METIEDKLGRATNFLHDIKSLGLSPGSPSEVSLFQRRVGQVIAELEDVRDLLTASARSVLSDRQLQVLEPQQEEEEEGVEHSAQSRVDPSIQFLGLEWEAIFGKCFNLGINIRIYRQRLASGMVDTLTLALVLRDITQVIAEVEQHNRAVLRSKQGEVVFQGFGARHEVSRSSQNLDTETSRPLQVVKYRKTKTEGLASKISKVAKRKSTQESQKKNSFVDSLTNLFKNSKL